MTLDDKVVTEISNVNPIVIHSVSQGLECCIASPHKQLGNV
jgi:hypothetical protein